jgi:hypothetical protein
MALYTSAASNGAPYVLVAGTNSVALSAGNNQIPVMVPAGVTAGTYWILAE